MLYLIVSLQICCYTTVSDFLALLQHESLSVMKLQSPRSFAHMQRQTDIFGSEIRQLTLSAIPPMLLNHTGGSGEEGRGVSTAADDQSGRAVEWAAQLSADLLGLCS